MNFVEEKTPSGKVIKILLDKWQYLAFDKMGRSIVNEVDEKSMMHHVPLIIFLGKDINFKMNYEKNYHLLKIRKGKIIIPYLLKGNRNFKYLFIPTDKNMDLMPARMFHVSTVAQMVKEYDSSVRPDYFVIDEKITSNDLIIIMSRYKVDENKIISISLYDSENLIKKYDVGDESRRVNINMMSDNPVYLAIIHLRSMDINKIYQLLLDFDITVLDTEYILNFIEDIIKKKDGDKDVKNNIDKLINIQKLYKFYLHLIQKSDDDVKEVISSIKNKKEITSFKTLISKVKSQYPGSDEQILYTEYENYVMDKMEELNSENVKKS